MIHPQLVRGKNFRPLEVFELPLVNQGLVLIQGRNLDTDAADSNGASKTTLISDSVCWCWFGTTITGEKGDDVIRDGVDRTEVTILSVDDQGHELEITRRAGKGGASLSASGAFKTAATMAETQAKLVDYLGLDFTAFKAANIYGQNDSAHFASPTITDSQQKAILRRVRRLDRLEAAAQRALKAQKEVKARLDVARGKMMRLEGSLAAVPKREALEAQRAQLGAHLDALRRQAAGEDPTKHEQARVGILALLTEFDETRAAGRELEEEARAADASVQKIRLQVEQAQRQVAVATRGLALYAKGACPTCGTPATAPHLANHLQELEGVHQTALSDEEIARGNLRQAEAVAQRRRQAVTEAAKALADEPRWRRQLQEVERKLWQAREAAQVVGRAEAELQALDRALAVRDAQEGQFRQELEVLQAEVTELETELRHIEFWSRGFSSTGLPSLLLDDLMPELTVRTNHYLDILSDGYLQVFFDNIAKTKKEEIRDKISIATMVNGRKVRPSGGLWRRITLATDLALLDIAGAQAGAGIDLLVLDEVLDGLDAAGCARIGVLLRSLRATRGSIFVISHDNRLVEVFDRTRHVTMENGVARLEPEGQTQRAKEAA